MHWSARSFAGSFARWSLLALLSLLQACGGSGGSTAGTAGPTPGSVGVVLDTRSGTDGLVQFVVVAAVLERGDGSTSGNLLPRAAAVTFADPSGEASGLLLEGVPTGNYERLVLALAPSSGSLLAADGVARPIEAATLLTVPITDGLEHASTAVTWLAVGHNQAPIVASGGSMRFEPNLVGRAEGSEHELAGLEPVTIHASSVEARMPAAGGSVLALEFEPGCTFGDDQSNAFPNAASFVASLASDDELRVRGTLDRDGTFRVHHARHGRGNDGPRLLGRIQELRPSTTSFVMSVQAEVRRGERTLRNPPVDVLVQAGTARLQRPDARVALAFADLAIDDLVKVKWSSRTPATATELELVSAREIEVTSGPGVPFEPEWEGLVQSVDQAAGRIVVVPRHDDPIVVDGAARSSVEVVVGPGTTLQRRARNGGGRTPISLADVVPNSDRIWWRGTVVGPTEIAASWVRVRED